MKIRNKRARLVLAATFVLVAGLIFVLARERRRLGLPQFITLTSGEKYQFAGVTYGYRAVPPSIGAEILSWLPAKLAKWLQPKIGIDISGSDSSQRSETQHLWVWFHHVGTNVPGRFVMAELFDAKLADQHGIEAGETGHFTITGGSAWAHVAFSVIPRRSPQLEFRLYPYLGGPPGPVAVISKIKLRNPVYGHFREWQPESVPAMKASEDLEVQLGNFATGVRMPGSSDGAKGVRSRPAENGENADTFFDVHLKSLKGSDDGWLTQSAILSDATGNVLKMNYYLGEYVIPGTPGGNFLPVSTIHRNGELYGTLWPDEAAWRLKLNFMHSGSFAPGELAVFRKVELPPAGSTNDMQVGCAASGVRLVLAQMVRGVATTVNTGDGTVVDHQPAETIILVKLMNKPADVAVDFVKMTTDTKVEIQKLSEQIEAKPAASAPFSLRVRLADIPAGAKSVDITFSIQKMRSVEFLVKPPKAN